jgi:hypothetical protein
MEHFWDLLFQLMKHGTNTLHVVFIFFVRYTSTVSLTGMEVSVMKATRLLPVMYAVYILDYF